MSSARVAIQRAALAVYETANRRGWLDSRVAEAAFQRAYFAYKRLVEDPFAKLVSAHPELFRGGDVLDIGANIGYTATVFARALDAGHRVHAFEPEARNFRWLGNVISRGRLSDRIIAQRSAVGSHDGTIELWRNTGHHADHRIATDALRATRHEPTESVPLVRLDSYVASCDWPAISFIKIDVQGYEGEVLRGMAETLARNPRIHVAVEYMPSAIADLGFDPASVLRELATALPRIAVLERDGQLREVGVDGVTAAGDRSEIGYVDLICSR